MRASVPFRLAQLRPHAHVQRRFASSSPGGGMNLNTEEAQKKAQEVVAAAGKRLGQAVEVGKKYMGPVGEKTGNMLGSYREPLLYNLSVAREFLKQVYTAERMQPPTSLAAFQNAYSTLWSRAASPAYWRELVRSGEWTKVGVYAVEAYGIFKIGEIIGRRSLVGYNVE
ncbi:hypothetical protein DAEQUDRAFT_730924 [Daedalea quercina L-15889]|uniref:Mitochondrial F1F0-ATP synthase g subunit n=1 Tax=Daedalea quercina L-15889 TaxID=1314783 RepID=A0A165MMG9_9APHY|nr:hypothetical protein DAEQUDRAFT_730924 [Daedalea quercina L-15889]